MSEIPIACTLDSSELRERQSGLHARLASALQERRELPDGYAFRFAAESELLQSLARFVDLERQCCPFLRFRLVLEPGKGPMWLELTGAEGSKETIQALMASLSVAPQE